MKNAQNRDTSNRSQSPQSTLDDSSVRNVIQKDFHRKPIQQRVAQISRLVPQLDTSSLEKGGLTPQLADHMIENCIGILPLPLGVSIGFKVNNKHYIVPMAIEEPSVIAACSVIAKLISEQAGGFNCVSSPAIMTGQIQFTDIQDFQMAKINLMSKRKEVLAQANTFCQSMYKRNGGAINLQMRELASDMCVVELHIDVKESMGANVVNTICEGVAPYIQSILNQGQVGVRILSNLCTERITLSTFRIHMDKLAWKGVTGREVAQKMIDTYRFATLDQWRATTHNKGVMNGIDAVAVALGQDWRAVESAAHSYASISGKYKPLTSYKIEGDYFLGRLEIPISVGTKGGAISTNPSYIATHQIMGYPTTEELAQVMVSVGLAQNMAAIRAMSIEGIQRGHMNLHARNMAIQAGIPVSLVSQAVHFMKTRNRINASTAQQFLRSHQLFTSSQQHAQQNLPDPSSFYVEIEEEFLKEPLILTIIMESKPGGPAYHLSVFNKQQQHVKGMEHQPSNAITQALFGKNYQWMASFLALMHGIRLPQSKVNGNGQTVDGVPHSQITLRYQLKLLTILTNLLISNMLQLDAQVTSTVVIQIKNLIEKEPEQLQKIKLKGQDNDALFIGQSLLKELCFKFVTYVNDASLCKELRNRLLGEYTVILNSLIDAYQLSHDVQTKQSDKSQIFDQFFKAKQKKMNLTMMLLCDCVGSQFNTNPNSDFTSLCNYIDKLGEVSEIRAVAFKDLSQTQSQANNLYQVWCQQFQKTSDGQEHLKSLNMRSKFLQFIENYCADQMQKHKVRESTHFSQTHYDELMLLIEDYYKLDPSLSLLAKRKQGQAIAKEKL